MSEIIGKGDQRRFYKTATAVHHESSPDGWRIELDGRQVKTPIGNLLCVPTRPLAERISEEWNEQGDKVVPASMPLTGLANAAIDRIASDPQVFIDQLIGYARSDLLCYWADSPEDLILRQNEIWLPVLDWFADTFNTRFTVTTGIVPIEQPPDVLDVIGGTLRKLDEFHLAGLADVAGAMNSVLLALAMWKREIDPHQAFKAAFLDELHQEEQWGEDHEALERRKIILNDVLSSSEFLRLLDMA